MGEITDNLGLKPAPAASDPEGNEPSAVARAGCFLWRALWDIVGAVLPAILIALFVNVFVAQAMVIQGPSMQPNLYYDQRVMVEKITYRFFHGPRRGDVVIIEVPGEDEPLIKRVVALPGEAVEVRNGQVFIDGQLLDEPWATRQGGPDHARTLLSPLHFFVLGDNRASSRDSRAFGAVPMDQIVGQAWLVYWPPDQIKIIP